MHLRVNEGHYEHLSSLAKRYRKNSDTIHLNPGSNSVSNVSAAKRVHTIAARAL